MKKKRLSKRILSFLLATVMTVGGASLTTAAASPSDPSYVESCYSSSSVSFASGKYLSVIKKVANAYLNYESEVDISSYRLPPSLAMPIQMAVVKSTPELSYVDNSVQYTMRTEQGETYLINLKPTYTASKSEAKKMITEYRAAADFYLDQLKDSLSVCNDDFSKALLLHDELILENRYQISGASPYTLMVKHFGKCEDYTRTYAYLLGQLGIRTEIISSSSMNHEWLRAKLDGKYYNIDVTWDDPTPDRPGSAAHQYFLLSDNANVNHYDFNYINATDTKYDYAAFHDYNSKLCKVNATEKAFYAADSSGKKIVKYNYANNSITTLIDLKDYIWSAGGNSYWPGIHTGLDMYNGLLYYNTPDAVYAYNPTTKISSKIAGNSSVNSYYGVRIRGGKLYGVTAANPNVSGTEVFLKDLTTQIVAVTGVKLNQSAITLEKGSTQTLTATVSPTNAANKTITWSTSNSKVATVSGGKVTAVAAGTATITAKSSNGKTASCTVTVKNPSTTVSSVTLSNTSLTLGKGETFTLKATVLPSSALNKTVTWTTSNSAVASVSGGKITAKGNGTAIITAKSNNGKTAKCTVTVKNAPTKVNLSKATLTLGVGETFSLSSTVNDGAASTSRTYRSSDSNIIKMTRTNWIGTFVAQKPGTASVTVRTYNGKETTCKITVRPAPTKISLTNTTLTLGVGESFTLGSNLNSGAACATRTYRTGDSSIVKMTRTDWVGTFVAQKVGTTYVTVRTYNGKEASCKVTVKAAPTWVSVNKTTMTLKVGQTASLSAYIASNAGCASRTYRSSNSSIIQMTKTNWTGEFKALKPGVAWVTVRTYNGMEASCKITVV